MIMAQSSFLFYLQQVYFDHHSYAADCFGTK